MSFVLLAGAGMAAFTSGRLYAFDMAARNDRYLRSRPSTHGLFVLAWVILPMFAIILWAGLFNASLVRDWLIAELPARLTDLTEAELHQYVARLSEVASERGGRFADTFDDAARGRLLELRGRFWSGTALAAILAGGVGFLVARRQQSLDAPLAARLERGLQWLFLASAGLAVLTTIGIVVSLAVETVRFLALVPLTDFLFGTNWDAQTNRDFGALPLFFGTFAVAAIAMLIAVPVGLYAAIYLAEYARPQTRRVIKPALEVLAGIPTVVYGFFAIMLVAPLVRAAALSLNGLAFVPDGLFAAQPTSALAAGIVLGIMIIPFVSSLSDDILVSVPESLRDGARSLGATQSEMIRHIILPAAMPGLVAAFLLAISRAVGETMIVVMAAGQRAQITPDLTSDLTTVTAQIVTLLTGDSAFDSPKTLSAFALGATLFLVTLLFNSAALIVTRRTRLAYD